MKWESENFEGSAAIMMLPYSVNVLLSGYLKLSRTFYNTVFIKRNKSGYYNDLDTIEQ